MTYAGFFVHLNDIPPVLRWLQWLCPLKYTLEALSVNEVGSGLMIEDSLEGVPVNVSAALIMQTVSSARKARSQGSRVLMTLELRAAIWIRGEQLLSGRTRAVRVHRRVWAWCNIRGLAPGARTPVTCSSVHVCVSLCILGRSWINALQVSFYRGLTIAVFSYTFVWRRAVVALVSAAATVVSNFQLSSAPHWRTYC